jgi:hypothetical protein
MRVYNLSDKEVTYRGRPIPANGGHLDYPGLSFIPDRDRKLETKRVLAFGSLPAWFEREQATKQAEMAKRAGIPVPTVDEAKHDPEAPADATVKPAEGDQVIIDAPKMADATDDISVKDETVLSTRSKRNRG